jgi:hypothetical protein
MEALRAWARQPTTVAGISALIGTISGVFLQQITWQQAVPLVAGSLVSIVLPDNSGAAKQVEALASTVVAELSSAKDAK